ncbi:hypothetical protein [Nitratireductor soli]|uniref:hypothetical protein n=1 Tax=Nitratireductor soli TaxID=1670619 RepID=UPI000A6B8CF6|nr:hypothetical protein [Nitratireductor soli]
MADARPLRLLIVEARFHDHLAAGLLKVPAAIAFAAAGKGGPDDDRAETALWSLT